jgi:hypothetical protein
MHCRLSPIIPRDLPGKRRASLAKPARKEIEEMKALFRLSLPSLLVLLPTLAGADTAIVIPLERAHSHNDYTRTRPLFEALDLGFCSIEADIYLVDGELLVAHDLKATRPNLTLRSMYLDPLRERVRKNGGRVYPGGPVVTLLIDIKDDGPTTYARLREVLKDYADMFAVTAIITGNCPREVMAAEPTRLAAVDGRRADLDSDASPNLIPWVSMDWDTVFKWKGKGDLPAAEATLLHDMVAKAHDKGRRIRFWGLPTPAVAWPVLYDAGVDLLNADNLAALQKLLLERQAKNAAAK